MISLPQLRAYQLAALISEARDDVTVSAPQLGKTILLGLWLIIGASRDADAGINLPSWWTAPTYLLVEQGMEKLVAMARSVEMLKSYREVPYPRVTLTNGGLIEGRSWEKPKHLYGPTVARIACDEFGQLTAEAYRVLKSRVSETRIRGLGYMRYAGNVGEIGGEAEGIWRHSISGAPGWAGRTWTWRDRAKAAACRCGLNGTGMEITDAGLHGERCERGAYLTELQDLQRRMSDAHFRQLYGAEWLDYSARPVYTFERAIHVDDSLEYDQHLPLDLSCDFNVDPMCWEIGQHRGEDVWTFDEIALTGGATTEAACVEFLNRYGSHRSGVTVYGDASGKARSTRSHKSDYDIITERLGHMVNFTTNVPEANPPVIDRVNAVNGRLRNAAGDIRYRIHPRCERLIEDRVKVSWKQGPRDIDKSDKSRTHASDADDYRVYRLFPTLTEQRVIVPRASVRHAPIDSIRTMEF